MTARLRVARPLLACALLVPASLGLSQAVTAQAATAPAQAASGAVAGTVTARTVSAVTAGSASQAKAAKAKAASAAKAKAARRLRLDAWHYAMRQRHKPYIWGGTGPAGFDCSGLVYAAYRSRGLTLPRTTFGMLDSSHLVRIRKSQARRGDLAFFGSGHVEVYDHGNWTYGAAHTGTTIGFHRMNAFWHPTMYFEVRR